MQIHGEVERIGQAEANAMLPVFNHPLQDEAREEKSETGYDHKQEKTVESGKQDDPGKSNCSHEKACTEIVVNVDGIAESSLNQPAARARNISGRKRDGLAEIIENLPDAFPHAGLLRGLLLYAQSA